MPWKQPLYGARQIREPWTSACLVTSRHLSQAVAPLGRELVERPEPFEPVAEGGQARVQLLPRLGSRDEPADDGVLLADDEDQNLGTGGASCESPGW